MSSSAQDKKKKTCMSKYGVSTPFEAASIQQKVRYTINSVYGVNSTALIPEVKNKQMTTRLNMYGVTHMFKSPAVQEAITDTLMFKYGVSRYSKLELPPNSSPNLENKGWMYDQHINQKKSLSQISVELGVGVNNMTTVMNYMRKHGVDTQHFSDSHGERQVAEYIELLGCVVERNNRTAISPYELDIYIPSLSLAIEYCGVYWHGQKHKPDISYHKRKYDMCKAAGIRLITLYEDEWLHKQPIVMSKITHIINQSIECVFARRCVVVTVNADDKRIFLNDHHIQGNGPGSITHGLMHDNQLVAVMTWIQAGEIFTLNRYASSVRVIGGFSKLVKHFQTTHSWSRIVSFADLRWSDGNVYKKMGWTLEKILPPDYAYVVNGRTKHKFAFRHSALNNKLANYDPLLSEWENMKANGYDRIWDCGKLKYAITNTNVG